jgi:hypothetical protein
MYVWHFNIYTYVFVVIIQVTNPLTIPGFDIIQ